MLHFAEAILRDRHGPRLDVLQELRHIPQVVRAMVADMGCAVVMNKVRHPGRLMTVVIGKVGDGVCLAPSRVMALHAQGDVRRNGGRYVDGAGLVALAVKHEASVVQREAVRQPGYVLLEPGDDHDEVCAPSLHVTAHV